MSGVKIKSLDWRDVCKVKPLMREMTDYHNQMSVSFKGIYPTNPLDSVVHSMEGDMYADGAQIDVAEVGGKIVGFCHYLVDDGIGKLMYLYVTEAYRCKGIGSSLMERAMGFFDLSTVKRIDIEVIHGNSSAAKFYSKYGFKIRTDVYSI